MKVSIFSICIRFVGRLNIFFVVYAFLGLLSGCSAGDPGGRIAIAFYNCEHFYDTIDNPLRMDDDFTPSGKNKYTGKVYLQKLHNMAVVLQSMKEPPAIIGLAEVENDRVLADLVRQPEIINRGYGYLWHEGPDERGMNVALLYDTVRFKVINSSWVPIALTDGDATRDVLVVSGEIAGDSLFVLVNHWPSRRGGVEESADRRAAAALVSKGIIGKIQKQYADARIVIMGDFNDNPTDSSLTRVLGASLQQNGVSSQGFYNPFAAMYAAGQGTIAYRHEWNLFDQVIVSGTLLSGGKLQYESAEIYKPAFLQSKHKDHKGEPYRSWLGSKWINGYSDHFPVVLYLSHK